MEYLLCKERNPSMSITSRALGSLVIFRRLLSVSPLKELSDLLSSGEDADLLSSRYAELAAVIYREGGDLTKILFNAICESENLYTDYLLRGTGDPALLLPLLGRELAILSEAGDYDGGDVRQRLGDGSLAVWHHHAADFPSLYRERMARIGTDGFGVFARYYAFSVGDTGELLPIRNPDPQTLSTLYGYESERGRVIANTEAFLAGRSANNVLLYGDAGTGKSSTVKAIANEYRNRGLRLIELRKNQLYLIPALMDRLNGNPLRFLFFIDDLTFASDDRDFCALKAILEGGVNSRGSNILIYATSNHRHMIKETVSDRSGDEVNVNDKIQEVVSLSARFGLTVTFSRADRDLYARIVCSMAKDAGIRLPEDLLLIRAEAHAIRAGGRNPRTARQFIDLLSGGVETV